MLRKGVTLYYVRHGETDWNAALRYQGQTDVPLNAKGRVQAARNGRRLKALIGAKATSLDYVASPLSRASETMRIARAEMGLDPDAFRHDDRLKEQHYGDWEGQLWHELPTVDPVGFAGHNRDKWNWCPRGGESYRMLSDRLAGWLSEVEHDVVVASHGAVSRVVRGLVLGLDGPMVTSLEIPQDKVLVLQDGRMSWE
ncbi:MAG: histidine phosphatase family protein [Hyphomicrobiaceae bacterium]